MKEKLLLHVCCAPCSIYVINKLSEKFDLAVYFYNPNIFPEEEYLQRLAEIKEYCQKRKILYLEDDYQPKEWLKYIQGYEKEPERGLRCNLCFFIRAIWLLDVSGPKKLNCLCGSGSGRQI